MEYYVINFSILLFYKKIVRLFIAILYLLLFVQSPLKAQETPSEVEGKRRYKAQSYLSGHVDYVYSYLNGVGGNERAQFYKDYVQDLNNNGIIAEGGLFGRHGFSFGVSYDQYLSRRYALHHQCSYWQTGYRENLNVVGQEESGEIVQSKKFKANLDYIHILSGLKYYSDYGVTLTLGGFVNYNIVDKIENTESSKMTGGFGDVDTSTSQQLYFHEYYGENRVVFLTGGVFSIGYKWHNVEFDASIKLTGPILDEIDNKIFNVYQFGIRYTIPTKKEDI